MQSGGLKELSREIIFFVGPVRLAHLLKMDNRGGEGEGMTERGSGEWEHGQLGLSLAFPPSFFSVQSYRLYVV
jgi:hypothetical protein